MVVVSHCDGQAAIMGLERNIRCVSAASCCFHTHTYTHIHILLTNQNMSLHILLHCRGRFQLSVVAPVLRSGKLTMDGDGGFHYAPAVRGRRVFQMKPSSVRSLWTAVQSLLKGWLRMMLALHTTAPPRSERSSATPTCIVCSARECRGGPEKRRDLAVAGPVHCPDSRPRGGRWFCWGWGLVHPLCVLIPPTDPLQLKRWSWERDTTPHLSELESIRQAAQDNENPTVAKSHGDSELERQMTKKLKELLFNSDLDSVTSKQVGRQRTGGRGEGWKRRRVSVCVCVRAYVRTYV